MRKRLCDNLKNCNIITLQSSENICNSRERIFFKILICLDRKIFIIILSYTGSTNNGMISGKIYIVFLIPHDYFSIRINRSDRLRNCGKERLISDEKEIHLSFSIYYLIGKLDVMEEKISDSISK